MKKITVLITGAGAPGAPGIIRSLRNNGERPVYIIGVDMDPKASGFSMVDEWYTVPKSCDDNFIDAVLGICIRRSVDIVIPLVTSELEKFAEAKQLFRSKSVEVIVPEYCVLTVANDKGKLLGYMNDNGLEVPKYHITSDVTGFVKAAHELGYPNGPFCFKPTISNGSRGFRIIDPNIDRSAILFNSKPTSVYTTYDEIINMLTEIGDIPELIVMEYLPGEEYSVDVLAEDGQSLFIIPRRRDRITGGISSRGTTVFEVDVIEYCRKIIAILGLSGNIGIQVRRDKEGKPMILEINPRMQGTIVLCTAAGVNMVYYGVKLALGEKLPEVNISWGTHMVRYWNEVYYDSDGHAFTL